MIWCVKCRRLAPEGQFCPWCLGTWNGAVCQGCGHRNLPRIPACVRCGGFSLSMPTVGIPLGWTTTLLSGLLFILLLRFVFTHHCQVVRWVEGAALWGASVVSGACPLAIKNFIWDLLAMVFLLAPLLGAMLKTLPGQGGFVGEWLRRLPASAFAFLMRSGQRLFVWLWRTLLRLFFARKAETTTGRVSGRAGNGGRRDEEGE